MLGDEIYGGITGSTLLIGDRQSTKAGMFNAARCHVQRPELGVCHKNGLMAPRGVYFCAPFPLQLSRCTGTGKGANHKAYPGYSITSLLVLFFFQHMENQMKIFGNEISNRTLLITGLLVLVLVSCMNSLAESGSKVSTTPQPTPSPSPTVPAISPSNSMTNDEVEQDMEQKAPVKSPPEENKNEAYLAAYRNLKPDSRADDADVIDNAKYICDLVDEKGSESAALKNYAGGNPEQDSIDQFNLVQSEKYCSSSIQAKFDNSKRIGAGIDILNYNTIEEGDSYQSVKDKFNGMPGVVLSQFEMSGIKTESRQWENYSAGGNVIVTFQNDKVQSKAQNGL